MAAVKSFKTSSSLVTRPTTTSTSDPSTLIDIGLSPSTSNSNLFSSLPQLNNLCLTISSESSTSLETEEDIIPINKEVEEEVEEEEDEDEEEGPDFYQRQLSYTQPSYMLEYEDNQTLTDSSSSEPSRVASPAAENYFEASQLSGALEGDDGGNEDVELCFRMNETGPPLLKEVLLEQGKIHAPLSTAILTVSN